MPHQFRMTQSLANKFANAILEDCALINIEAPSFNIKDQTNGTKPLENKAKAIRANWFLLGFIANGLDNNGSYHSARNQGNTALKLLSVALLNKGWHLSVRSFAGLWGTVLFLTKEERLNVVPLCEYNTVPTFYISHITDFST